MCVTHTHRKKNTHIETTETYKHKYADKQTETQLHLTSAPPTITQTYTSIYYDRNRLTRTKKYIYVYRQRNTKTQDAKKIITNKHF